MKARNPNEVSERGKIIRDYCERHPTMPHFTLARMIDRDHPDRWNEVSTIYQAIRYHRGKKVIRGKKSKAPIKSDVQSTTIPEYHRVPDSWAKDRSPFVIAGAQRIAVLSDIHFPIHSQRALDAAINESIKMNPTIVLLNGDIADLHDFAFHERETMRSYVDREVEMLVDFFATLRDTFPDSRIVYKLGNH